MGAKHSSSPSLSLAMSTEDQATALPKYHRYSLNFPRLHSSHKKMKNKRNISATFNINESESAYDSQESNPQSCISSLSSNHNVFSSTSSVSNGSPPATAATTCSDRNTGISIVSSEFSKEQFLLNINSATEEGLMTLPGVTRQTARNVVSYRKLIGGFKNIQDIALVSGVGATLYVRFRSDITCHGLSPEVCQEYPNLHSDLTLNSNNKSKSSTLSKHSSASSSGIDIATINEDDDALRDCQKTSHHHHHHHHNNNNNNNKTSGLDQGDDNNTFASKAYKSDVRFE